MKLIYNYFKRSARLHSNGFLVKIILHIRYKAVLNVCIFVKLCVKPMGNFAKNLDLGKHVLNLFNPLYKLCHFKWAVMAMRILMYAQCRRDKNVPTRMYNNRQNALMSLPT